MLHKYGIQLKIAQTGKSLQELVAKQEEFTAKETGEIIESRNPDFLYIRGRAISADEPNGNGDYFPRQELEASYKTFIGVNMFVNHNSSDPRNAIGKVLDAYPVEDPETGEFYIECLGKIDKVLNPRLARQIETGQLDSTSMGCSVETSICSVCGTTLHTDADPKCAHLSEGLLKEFSATQDLKKYGISRGQKIKAYAINIGITFNEWSVVDTPADPKATIKSIVAKLKNMITKVGSLSLEEKSDVVDSLEKMIIFLDPTDTRAVRKEVCSILDNQSEKEEADNMTANKESAVDKILEKLNAREYKTLVADILKETPGEHVHNKKTDEVNLDVTPRADLSLSAVYVKKDDIRDSYWLVRQGSKPILKATMSQIWEEQDFEDKSLMTFATSDEYKKMLLDRIRDKGLETVAQLLTGKKISGFEEVVEVIDLKNKEEEKNMKRKANAPSGFKIKEEFGTTSPSHKKHKTEYNIGLKDRNMKSLPEGKEVTKPSSKYEQEHKKVVTDQDKATKSVPKSQDVVKTIYEAGTHLKASAQKVKTKLEGFLKEAKIEVDAIQVLESFTEDLGFEVEAMETLIEKCPKCVEKFAKILQEKIKVAKKTVTEVKEENKKKIDHMSDEAQDMWAKVFVNAYDYAKEEGKSEAEEYAARTAWSQVGEKYPEYKKVSQKKKANKVPIQEAALEIEKNINDELWSSDDPEVIEKRKSLEEAISQLQDIYDYADWLNERDFESDDKVRLIIWAEELMKGKKSSKRVLQKKEAQPVEGTLPDEALDALGKKYRKGAEFDNSKCIADMMDEDFIEVKEGEDKEDAAARFCRWLEGRTIGEYGPTRESSQKKDASAFDKQDIIIIDEGIVAEKDAGTKEIVIKDVKKGEELKRLPDAFGDDIPPIIKLLRNILGLEEPEKESEEVVSDELAEELQEDNIEEQVSEEIDIEASDLEEEIKQQIEGQKLEEEMEKEAEKETEEETEETEETVEKEAEKETEETVEKEAEKEIEEEEIEEEIVEKEVEKETEEEIEEKKESIQAEEDDLIEEIEEKVEEMGEKVEELKEIEEQEKEIESEEMKVLEEDEEEGIESSLKEKVKQLEAEKQMLEAKNKSLAMEKLLEEKANRCRDIVARMVEKGLLSYSDDDVQQYKKEGLGLLDARAKALKAVKNLQVKELLAMDDDTLNAFEKSIDRIKRTASNNMVNDDVLDTPFKITSEETADLGDWMQNLNWD